MDAYTTRSLYYCILPYTVFHSKELNWLLKFRLLGKWNILRLVLPWFYACSYLFYRKVRQGIWFAWLCSADKINNKKESKKLWIMKVLIISVLKQFKINLTGATMVLSQIHIGNKLSCYQWINRISRARLKR